ncbi:cellular communication network factor 4b [Engraulis encrasicolus]|uniref:cellular communication network factor 4b n=1 Tax=Engraulis encrasicolus TaxID=184585 RepID=UPI002FD1CB48
MRWLLPWILTVASIYQTISQNLSTNEVVDTVEPYNRTLYCKWPCKCPKTPPSCPLGVSLMTDGCECCKACAKQVGQTCNERDSCDYHKGLYCDYSADKPRYEKGVCAYMIGTGCEYDGVIYYNGQSFQPSCKYSCMCVNGAIGCVSLCASLPPPRVWCRSPRRVTVRGQCCETWVCDDAHKPRRTSARHVLPSADSDTTAEMRSRTTQQQKQPKLQQKPPLKKQEQQQQQQQKEPQQQEQQQPQQGNESQQDQDQQQQPEWQQENAKQRDQQQPQQENDQQQEQEQKKNCISQSTPWSPCSKTCGRGLSLRISNDNARCEMVKESRLCTIRPCEVDITKHIKEGKKCLHIYREPQHQFLMFSGCRSTKPYWPKYCGVCYSTDDRCCIPYKSKTIEVEFQCPNGAVLSWKMMWINACFCNLSCRNPNDIFSDLNQFYDHNEIVN